MAKSENAGGGSAESIHGLRITALHQKNLGIWDLLAAYPEGCPKLMLGSSRSDWSMFALAWDEIDYQVVARQGPSLPRIQTYLPWTLGTVVLHSYDAWAPVPQQDKHPSRAFRVRRAIILDQTSRAAFLCEEDGADGCQWQLPLSAIARSSVAACYQSTAKPVWVAQQSEAHYLGQVEEIIEEIRDGRYYQLNLLRYWLSEDHLSRDYWLGRMQEAAGPYAAWIDCQDIGLVSCSPERFVNLGHDHDGIWIQAEPIKGTRPVLAEAAANALMLADLASHPKDRAELSMIIDLMRNDLLHICERGSVKVLDPGSVHSFEHVHHLVAKIRGRLSPDVSWHHIWTALCPGGSITGAPKKEVMLAIREREQRDRGYFMGNIFYIDHYTGHSDSSILIRTAQRRGDGRWEYAAGSGLVIHSQAQDELAEVLAKARVIL